MNKIKEKIKIFLTFLGNSIFDFSENQTFFFFKMNLYFGKVHTNTFLSFIYIYYLLVYIFITSLLFSLNYTLKYLIFIQILLK